MRDAYPHAVMMHWPQLADVDVRFHAKFAYITGQLPDGTRLPLCRLRYVGYASA
jgi:hypothetical protein